jgi:hypothetical protein
MPGGAVGEYRAEPGGDGEDRAADGERGECCAAEMADDGRVDQDAEGLGGEYGQRGEGEAGDAPCGDVGAVRPGEGHRLNLAADG